MRSLYSVVGIGLLLVAGACPAESGDSGDTAGTPAGTSSSGGVSATGLNPTAGAETASGGAGTTMAPADTTAGAADGSNCLAQTNQSDCVAEQWDGYEGYAVACTWIATVLYADTMMCTESPVGHCIPFYGALDGCENPPPPTMCEGGSEGIIWFEAPDGIEVGPWAGDDCSTPPGTPCDLEGVTAAADACNCYCAQG